MFGLFKRNSQKDANLAFADKADAEVSHSPDIAKLCLSEHQLLFVCDEMRIGMNEHHRVNETGAFVTHAFTQKSFCFIRHETETKTSFVPLQTPDLICQAPMRKIMGEVHAVASTSIPKIDTAMQNGVQFRRERVRLVTPYRMLPLSDNKDVDGRRLPPALQGKMGQLSGEFVFLHEAWMYVAIQDYWNPKLNRHYFDGGKDVSPVWISKPHKDRPWLPGYYNHVRPYEKKTK